MEIDLSRKIGSRKIRGSTAPSLVVLLITLVLY